MARRAVLVVGLFTLVNAVGGLLRPGYDQNLLWIDLRAVPAGDALLAAAGAVLVAAGLRWPAAGWRRRVTTITVSGLVAAALANAATFYVLLGRGEIRSEVPVPFSLLVAVVLGAALVSRRTASLRALPVVAVGLAVAFPLALIIQFGGTDYRRPADAVVVLGARAYSDGTPSLALADRVRTACDLYHEGLAGTLVLSGGPADGDMHETESMRRLATNLGVPDEAILLDPDGVSTRATALGATRLLDDVGAVRVLAVSHAFHLPRVKMAFARAGREVYTVPARETRPLRQAPYLLVREVAAFWWYWLRG